MEPKNPEFEAAARAIFDDAPFIRDLGIALVSAGAGHCETRLDVTDRLRQHDGFIHAGVVATMADHTAGAAAGSLVAADEIVLTSEYKVHFLRAGRRGPLRCRADVVKPGNRLSIVQADVFEPGEDGSERHIARLLATMAVLPRPA